MKKSISTLMATVSALVLYMIPVTGISASAENVANFTISCSDTVYVGDDCVTTISCNSNTEFESLQFELTFNSEVLEYSNTYNVTSDKGVPSDYSVSNVEDGVVYILFPDTTKYHNMNVSVTFTAKAEGNSNFSVNVSEIMQDEDNSVPTLGNPVANKSISVVAKQTETTTTTTETTTTETTTTTTTSTQQPSESTTTTTSTQQPSDSTTTTSSTQQPSDSTTTTSSTQQPSDSATTTTSTQQPANSTTTTSKRTTSANSTTTAKSTTTSSQDSNEIPKTGDNFPTLPLAVALGISASIAVVTKKHNKS